MRASFQVSCSPWPNYKRKHKSAYFTVKTGSTQAQAQAQGSKFFLFLVLALMLALAACACVMLVFS